MVLILSFSFFMISCQEMVDNTPGETVIEVPTENEETPIDEERVEGMIHSSDLTRLKNLSILPDLKQKIQNSVNQQQSALKKSWRSSSLTSTNTELYPFNESTTNYFYSGDGARVKKSANGVTTYYVGNLYEYTVWTGGSSTSKYYYFGGQRVAVKQDINVSYIHGDHLGSTSKTTGATSQTARWLGRALMRWRAFSASGR